MRDYQTKANQGALPDSNSTTKYGAGEVNSLRSENKNAVSAAGLTLAPQDGTGEDTTQLAQSLLINGVAAQAVQDSGAADAIVLTPVTGSSGLRLPPDYTTLDGAEFSFFAAFANATATPTASIGQTAGTQFAAKTIVREDGSALVAGDIDTTVMTTLRRDDANDRWLLVRGAGTQGSDAVSAVVTEIDTRTTTGTWSLTGLTIGKPLIITGSLDVATNGGANIKAISGTNDGKTVTANVGFQIYGQNIGNHPVTGNSLIYIPTATTVSLNVEAINATSMILYAYN